MACYLRRCGKTGSIPCDGLQRQFTDRHNPLFPALPPKSEKTFGAMNIAHIERDQFAHAGSRRIERFEQRTVTQRSRRFAGGKGHEGVGIIFGQDPWKRPCLFGCPQRVDGIAIRETPTAEITIEASDRGQFSRQ